MRKALGSLSNKIKLQYIIFTVMFGMLGLHRIILKKYRSGIAQCLMFIMPLVMLSGNELSKDTAQTHMIAYTLLTIALGWWLRDVLVWALSVLPTIGHPLLAPQPQIEEVRLKLVSTNELEFGEVIGMFRQRPIYEWVARRDPTKSDKESKAYFEGVVSPTLTPNQNDIVMAPGLVYRTKQAA
jgi:hypothetical protein